MQVAITPDGTSVVSGSNEALRVWDCNSGKTVRLLYADTDAFCALAVSEDSRFVFAAFQDFYEGDSYILQWDLATGRNTLCCRGQQGRIRALALTADSRSILSGAYQETRVVDLSDGGARFRLLGDPADINDLAITSDGKFALTAQADSALTIWDLQTGQVARRLVGSSGGVVGVRFLAGDKFVVSCSLDGALTLWSFDQGKPLRQIGGETMFQSLAVSATAAVIIAGDKSGTVHFFHPAGFDKAVAAGELIGKFITDRAASPARHKSWSICELATRAYHAGGDAATSRVPRFS
jgi:WD40 repeat protein